MRDDTILVSIIWVNNEIGTVSEIPAIGALCQARGVLFHTDATQRIGMRSVDVVRDGIDLLSFSGHKICGPKGSGALYARRRDGAVALEPIIHGGAHEGGLRAGTLNVPGIVGLARALEICRDEMEEEATRLARLRDHLEESLRARIEGVLVNGDPQRRAPHVSNLCFASVRGVALIDHVEEVACSSGAAISSSGRAVSHVLRAIGVPDDLAVTSLRLSLGRFTTEEEIDAAVDALARVVQEAESVRAARR